MSLDPRAREDCKKRSGEPLREGGSNRSGWQSGWVGEVYFFLGGGDDDDE